MLKKSKYYWCVVCLIVLFSLLNCQSVYAGDKQGDKKQEKSQEKEQVVSIKGAVKDQMLLKLYLLMGYQWPMVFRYNDSDSGGFFGNLAVFQNWRVGGGLRIASFFGLEIAYTSAALNIYPVKNDSAGDSVQLQEKMLAQYIYVASTFYSPALDLKFVTLELAGSIGIAGMFGINYSVTEAQTGAPNDNFPDYSVPGSAQLFAGVSLILGFKRNITVRGFVECVTLNDEINDLNIMMTTGIAINAYLI